MSLKVSGQATEWREIDRFDGGVGWIAYPEETMQRASHALAVDGDVWVIDPVDAEGIDDLLAEYGEVRGVVVLLDRHTRDAARIARRHDVSVWLPVFMDGVASKIDAPIERFKYELADTGYLAHEIIDNRLWQEYLLYNEETGVLVVPEAVGTADYFRADDEPLGVHPALRLTPPRKLARLDAKRLLVGHGSGIDENAGEMLKRTIQKSRKNTPALCWKNMQQFLPG